MGVRPTALVTGGAHRLGRAMVCRLFSQGYNVVIHANTSMADAERLARRLKRSAPHRQSAVAVSADLRIDSEVQSLVHRAAAAVGSPLTVLVNNASIFEYDDVSTASLETWDRHVASNLKAPLLLTQAFYKHHTRSFPRMQRCSAGEAVATGCIINMVDCHVLGSDPTFLTYSLAKTALFDLTKRTAQALGPRVRVNAIGPGPTLPSARQLQRNAVSSFRRQRRNLLLGRGPNPDDLCDALDYFLSAKAVTGQLLCIDGGAHLAWGHRCPKE